MLAISHQKSRQGKKFTTENSLLQITEGKHTRIKHTKKLTFLMMKIDSQRSIPCSLNNQRGYYEKIVEGTKLQSKK